MHVWLFQIGEILPLTREYRKMRTAYLADKLVARGHKVTWWASAFDHTSKSWLFRKDVFLDMQPNLRLAALKGIRYRRNISLARFIDHRIIAHKFRRLATYMEKPNVMVASMPSYDLAYEAVLFAKKYNIPIIVDVRDEWPDIFLDPVPMFLQPLARLLLVNDFQMVRKVCEEATCLVSMTDHLLDWALGKGGRSMREKDKVFYIGAKRTDMSSVKLAERLRYLQDRVKEKFVVCFIGTFGKYYNPAILIDAARKLAHEHIHFVVCGDGFLFPEMKTASKRMGNVTLTGWLHEEEIAYVLSLSAVGIIPCTQPIMAFPNKAFTYFSAGLPVISSLGGDLKIVIGDQQIGFYYPPNDVETLVKCIRTLHDDPVLYRTMSDNVRRIFDANFDADKIYSDYAEHIERVVQDREKSLLSAHEIRLP